ncbi:MAG TPA: (2Fe-2S)-binding protein [Thermoanaerobaculia bacterium]|nr:(2Fe-2S)-binding protein [Thermoanaerobaculia bacterium]
MIVCICRAGTDRDIAAAIEEGASSLFDLQRCGFGTDCGTCHASLRQMLATADEPAAAATHPPAPQPVTVAVSA